MFPAFQELNVEAVHRIRIDYHKRGKDTLERFSIKLSYKYLWEENKHLVSTGASTYGEVTQLGVNQIIKNIQKEFLSLLSEKEIENF